MRKLLMASAAILGASNGLAFAQTSPAAPSQGQLAAPYGAGPAANNNNNAWGVANTPTGSAAAGPLSTVYAPNVNAVPAPGTIVIRLNGRVEVDFGATFTSADRGFVAATASPPGNAGLSGSYKTNPIGIASYMRLYPGFDGLAANGLRYGASVELRENFGAGANTTTTTSATGAVTTTSTAFSPSANTSAQTVFVRRAFTYLASDKVGLVRLGQTDGVLGLFDNCIFTSQCWDAGLGNFNGGPLQSMTPQAAVAIPFVWLSQAGAEYGNNKIVYLSPQFYGFDFGVQYAPSMGNAFQNAGLNVGCTQSSANCISLTSGNDPTRWYNQVGLGLRWQQSFGAVDVKAYGFYETAGKENLTAGLGVQPLATTPLAARAANRLAYDNLGFYKAGVAVTAFNVTAAFDYIGGNVNGQLQMKPSGGANMNAWVTGLTYANGPLILGAEFGLIQSQGDARLAGISQRREYEIGVGGNYRLAPGVQLVGEYMYMNRYQGAYNFNTNTVGATQSAQAQGFLFSTVLTW